MESLNFFAAGLFCAFVGGDFDFVLDCGRRLLRFDDISVDLDSDFRDFSASASSLVLDVSLPYCGYRPLSAYVIGGWHFVYLTFLLSAVGAAFASFGFACRRSKLLSARNWLSPLRPRLYRRSLLSLQIKNGFVVEKPHTSETA